MRLEEGQGEGARGRRCRTQQDATEFKNAAKECDSERTADATAFAEKYGTNENNRNAFGKCVSSKASEDETESA